MNARIVDFGRFHRHSVWRVLDRRVNFIAKVVLGWISNHLVLLNDAFEQVSNLAVCFIFTIGRDDRDIVVTTVYTLWSPPS